MGFQFAGSLYVPVVKTTESFSKHNGNVWSSTSTTSSRFTFVLNITRKMIILRCCFAVDDGKNIPALTKSIMKLHVQNRK